MHPKTRIGGVVEVEEPSTIGWHGNGGAVAPPFEMTGAVKNDNCLIRYR